MDDEILERFKKGIRKFNSKDFYDCHDILEDVWFDIRGSSRRFYQGLIHLAVGFYHMMERENPKGAISQLTKGITKLHEYEPDFQGVELKKLLEQVKICIKEIEIIEKEKSGKDITKLIPEIEFNAGKFE